MVTVRVLRERRLGGIDPCSAVSRLGPILTHIRFSLAHEEVNR